MTLAGAFLAIFAVAAAVTYLSVPFVAMSEVDRWWP